MLISADDFRYSEPPRPKVCHLPKSPAPLSPSFSPAFSLLLTSLARTPPRPKLFERCMREYHSHIYANFAHLLRDVASLRPMEALQV